MSEDATTKPAPADPDAALMLQAAGGDRDAFCELIRRHQNKLLNFFTRMGAYNEAEDLVQETFLRLYRHRSRYKPSARFTTYLYVLARHVWADLGRKTVRKERLETSLKTDAELVPRKEPVADRARLDAEAAVASLSPKLREVVVLNVYQGLKYQEIADALGIPLGTVKSRLNMALDELRKFFDADRTEQD